VGITQQPYQYVADNPLDGTDPLGLAGNLCDNTGSQAAQQACMNHLNPTRTSGVQPNTNLCGPNYDQTGICPGHPEYDFAVVRAEFVSEGVWCACAHLIWPHLGG
jgi:hypothetical protein